MMFLEYHNNVIEDILIGLFYRIRRPKLLDMKFNDFSGISYHLSTPDEGRLDQLRLSIHWECWAQLVQYGAMDVLEREYGPWIASPPEEGYDFTLEFNVDGLVRDDDPEKAIRNVALLRRNALSGAFERAFRAQAQAKEENDPNFDPNSIEFMRIDPHRDERMYIRHHRDYTTLIIGIALDDLDEADRLFVKFTFEELKHRSRLPYYCFKAPRVIHANLEPPPEICHLEEVVQDTSGCRAYITFLIPPSLIATKERRDYIISQRMIFRDYMQYHIKGAKGFLKMRMRRRFSDLIKRLERTRKDYVLPKSPIRIRGG
ncbi:Arp2/3 complex, 34 kd subunit p34-Arc-domain-containing protein [Linnemannia elongata]|nr:Arp2/3 complex, 34 kd subunit p34-Arc-domain-containing protein [Linnemannia elongata]